MNETLQTELRHAAVGAENNFHRLVLAAGSSGSGKSSVLNVLAETQGWTLLNVNLLLSEALLPLTRRQRSLRADRLLREIVSEAGGAVTLLDNIEILFGSDLMLDPLRLLQGLSRNRTIVAAWPGPLEGNALVYGKPEHPEYRRETNPSATIVACGQSNRGRTLG